MNYKKPRLILLLWHDAETDTGWDKRDATDISKEVIVQSVGWLVAQNKHTYLLVADKGTGDEINNTNRSLRIPKISAKSFAYLDIDKFVMIDAEHLETL